MELKTGTSQNTSQEPIPYQSMIYYAETDEKFEDSAYKDFL